MKLNQNFFLQIKDLYETKLKIWEKGKNYINIQEMTMISNNKQIGVIIHIKIVKSSVIN